MKTPITTATARMKLPQMRHSPIPVEEMPPPPTTEYEATRTAVPPAPEVETEVLESFDVRL